MKEKQLQNNFIQWLRKNNIPYYKTQGGMVYTKEGQPLIFKKGYADLLVFLNGLVLFVELKTDIGTIRDEQLWKFKQLKENGFNQFYIMRPRHWEIVKKEFKENGRNALQAILTGCSKVLIEGNEYFITNTKNPGKWKHLKDKEKEG